MMIQMKIGLFIPCYVDALYPKVGVASYRLLKSLGLDVDYPLGQTCCGQPQSNGGFEDMARSHAAMYEHMSCLPPLRRLFLHIFHTRAYRRQSGYGEGRKEIFRQCKRLLPLLFMRQRVPCKGKSLGADIFMETVSQGYRQGRSVEETHERRDEVHI